MIVSISSKSALSYKFAKQRISSCAVRPKLQNDQGDAALAFGQAAAQDLGCPVRYCDPVCQPESISSLTRRGGSAAPSGHRAARQSVRFWDQATGQGQQLRGIEYVT